MIYDYQQSDIDRLTDTSRPLTPLMKQWIEEAEMSRTDLGYDDWKALRRSKRGTK